VDDKVGELREAFEDLVSSWKFVLERVQLAEEVWRELLELFGVTNAVAKEQGYGDFEGLQRVVEVKILDSTLKDFEG
jgi:hypothetical protein